MPTPIKYQDWKASASIDFITITLPKKMRSPAYLSRFSFRGKGNVEYPSKLGRSHPYGCDWLSIHNPDREALQFLIDEFPNAEILKLEFSVDFRPRSGATTMAELEEAKAWLAHALYPAKHPRMADMTRRKAYHFKDSKIASIGLGKAAGISTVYWDTWTAHEHVRLYVKTKDKHIAPFSPSVRLEATFDRGGCQQAGIARLKDFPSFAECSRKYLSPFFELATGIKPKIKRARVKTPSKGASLALANLRERERVERAWKKYGATWAVKRRYKVIPDKDGNRLVGTALNELRRMLKKLKLP